MLLDCIFLLLRPVGSMVVVRSMAEEKRRGNERQASGGRIGSRRAALDLSSSGDVRSAITHLRANLHRAVPIGELAAETGVSERTLRDQDRKSVV